MKTNSISICSLFLICVSACQLAIEPYQDATSLPVAQNDVTDEPATPVSIPTPTIIKPLTPEPSVTPAKTAVSEAALTPTPLPSLVEESNQPTPFPTLVDKKEEILTLRAFFDDDAMNGADWSRLNNNLILTHGGLPGPRVWDTVAEQLRFEVHSHGSAHNGSLVDAKWSPDETLLLSTGFDGLVVV